MALAQWETMSLDKETLLKVESIVTSCDDLKIWKELDADERTLERRSKQLLSFIEKLNSKRKRAKLRSSIKIKPVFKKGACLTFKLSNGNYGGCVVLEADETKGFEYGRNLVAVTRINSASEPTLNDFNKSEVLIENYNPKTLEHARKQIVWFLPDFYKSRYSNIYWIVGELKIDTTFSVNDREFFSSAG